MDKHQIVPFEVKQKFDLTVGIAFTVHANSPSEAIDKMWNLLHKLNDFETEDCQVYCMGLDSINEKQILTRDKDN